MRTGATAIVEVAGPGEDVSKCCYGPVGRGLLDEEPRLF
jgi:hypothetical protein